MGVDFFVARNADPELRKEVPLSRDKTGSLKSSLIRK